MKKSKLSSKGQIVIPSSLRKKLGWSEGMELEIIEEENGVYLTPRKKIKRTTLEEVAGCLGRAEKLSEDEIQKLLEEDIRRSYGNH